MTIPLKKGIVAQVDPAFKRKFCGAAESSVLICVFCQRHKQSSLGQLLVAAPVANKNVALREN
jgi:hypothetical protein